MAGEAQRRLTDTDDGFESRRKSCNAGVCPCTDKVTKAEGG